MKQPYEPAEDSFLMLKHVERLVNGLVLDMGTGRGIQTVAAASKPGVSRVIALDVNPEAVKEARRNSLEAGVSEKIDFCVSNLFQGLGNVRFDWIVFNPPYLPSEGDIDEVSWAGGQIGREIISAFLSEALAYLKPTGGILLVYSTMTGLEIEWVENFFNIVLIEELPLFFERLFCVLLKPVNLS